MKEEHGMKQSVGKDAARTFFYKELLSSWLSKEQIQSGNFLLLLGEEPREIPLLDELGVPRYRIWSVECDHDIYLKQMEWHLGVSLYYEQMFQYLLRVLHTNRRFLVLNLDIEGSYLKHLDPAMTSVLLFAWTNPATVVATYHSIGRDEETLWEGLTSLALFLLVNRELTISVFKSLTSRYEKADFDEPERMVLRDFFWLRSHLEHTIEASIATGGCPKISEQLKGLRELIWSRLTTAKKTPLRLKFLCELVEGITIRQETKEALDFACLGLHMENLQQLVYRAQRPWSQSCYFVKYRALNLPVSCRKWLEDALDLVQGTALAYIDWEGHRFDFGTDVLANGLSMNDILWPYEDWYVKHKPRQIASEFLDLPAIKRTTEILRDASLRPSVGSVEKKIDQPRKEGTEEMGRANGSKNMVQDGELTDFAKDEVRRYAKLAVGLNGQDISKLLGPNVASSPKLVKSVIAIMAIARRQPKEAAKVKPSVKKAAKTTKTKANKAKK
jgi:hypothetical protein